MYVYIRIYMCVHIYGLIVLHLDIFFTPPFDYEYIAYHYNYRYRYRHHRRHYYHHYYHCYTLTVRPKTTCVTTCAPHLLTSIGRRPVSVAHEYIYIFTYI